MAERHSDPAGYFKRAAARGARVLLINPPVEEKRYHWIRWNQPSDLLRLSTWLKGESKKVDVRLFDFMAPDQAGAVPKRRAKQWGDPNVWHFGKPYDAFEHAFLKWRREGWVPNVIVVTSLCSYWHSSITTLVHEICMKLGPQLRRKVKICLYGNYPRFEPDDAAAVRGVDTVFTESVDTTRCAPDFELHEQATGHPPTFFAFDINDPNVVEHIDRTIAYAKRKYEALRFAHFPGVTGTFFNDDLCSPRSQLASIAENAEHHPKAIRFEGICGVEPERVTGDALDLMRRAGFRSLFVEHARSNGGGLNQSAYAPIRDELRAQTHAKRVGAVSRVWCNVTGFVKIGLPGDDVDVLVETALELNSWFQSIILKPYGYSPTIDSATRNSRWQTPHLSSPQRFPYIGHGSNLTMVDYENLMRFQNLLNRRVKGMTFDFLGNGTVARLVRETLIGETWKSSVAG